MKMKKTVILAISLLLIFSLPAFATDSAPEKYKVFKEVTGDPLTINKQTEENAALRDAATAIPYLNLYVDLSYNAYSKATLTVVEGTVVDFLEIQHYLFEDNVLVDQNYESKELAPFGYVLKSEVSQDPYDSGSGYLVQAFYNMIEDGMWAGTVLEQEM